MRIYVASKFENVDEVRFYQRELKKAGHTITFDWTSYNDTPLQEKGLETALAAYRQKCALLDMEGVRSADALVLIPCPEMGGWGRYAEFGAAAILRKDIIVVGECRESVFLYLPCVRRVTDLTMATNLLQVLETEMAHARSEAGPAQLLATHLIPDLGGAV